MSERTDEELLAAWSAGEKAAGEALYTRHFGSIYEFFSRKVDGDVSDLVQRTFVGLTEARERFRGEAKVRTFLYGIARNELSRHYAAKQRAGRLDFGVSSLEDLAPSPSSLARRRDDRWLLAEALRRIPLDLQIALELHYWENLGGAEIAAVLEVPEGTVRSRLRRGLELLRAKMEALAGSQRGPWTDEEALETWARETSPYDR